MAIENLSECGASTTTYRLTDINVLQNLRNSLPN